MTMSILSLPLANINDQSVMILQQILGPVVQNIIGTPCTDSAGGACTVGTAFPDMIRAFNYLLLGFGTIIFAIMLFVGTMNSAADGQFLGRECNGVWTILRLMFGLAFIFPLQQGFCFGQYVFLYIILIGVNMGTSLWNSVLQDAFTNYTAPAIPSYIFNDAMVMIEQNLVLDTISSFMNVEGNGTSSTVAFNQTLTPETITPPVAQIISNLINGQIAVDKNNIQSYVTPPSPAACVNIYGLPAAVQDCENDLMTALASPGSFTGIPWGPPGNSGMAYFFIGTKPPASLTGLGPLMMTNTKAFIAAWPGGQPNQSIQAQGSFTFSFSQSKTVPNAIGQFGQDVIYGPPGSSAPPPLPFPTDVPSSEAFNNRYALNSTTQTYVQTVMQSIYDNPQNQTFQKCTQGEVSDSNGDFTYTCSMNDDSNNPSVPSAANNYSYTISGIPYVPNNSSTGQPVYGPGITIPMGNSWWYAGESYLILDQQYASNLQQLSQAINNLMIDFSGNGNVTGGISLGFNYAVLLQGELALPVASSPFMNTNYSIVRDTGTSAGGVANANDYYTAMVDQERGYFMQTFKIDPNCGASSSGAPPAGTNCQTNVDLSALSVGSSSEAWLTAIGPYNPNQSTNPVTSSGATSNIAGGVTPTPVSYACIDANRTQALYNQLLNTPGIYQVPLELLFQYLGNCTSTANYTAAHDAVQNLMNVLQVNGVLQVSQETLPVNQAMNSMFSKLMGNAGVANVANGGTPVSLNSVMQDVYNLGLDDNSNIVGGQFSLIQEVRGAGIEMITTCITSMQDVYLQYQLVINGLLAQVKKTETDAQVGAALSATGAIPFIGPISAAAGQAVMLNATLHIQVLTLTTMSNIGMQLMWLPLFLFVMTSLFTAGVQFALVMPFMPYMMFWGGQMAWVIGVIEALIAAPLVMLGIAHPGGNQYFGHALPAVKMLIGIVFRPVLMVIGLTVGILLTYILINYSAEGFHIVADSTFNTLPTGNTTLAGIMSCLLLFTYCSFLMMAFTKCFSPIYSIPENVVQWIGGQAGSAGKEESQQFAQSAEKTAGAAAQAGGEALSKGIQSQQTRGQNMSDVTQKKEQTKFDQNSAISKGVGDSIQQVGKAAAGGE